MFRKSPPPQSSGLTLVFIDSWRWGHCASPKHWTVYQAGSVYIVIKIQVFCEMTSCWVVYFENWWTTLPRKVTIYQSTEQNIPENVHIHHTSVKTQISHLRLPSHPISCTISSPANRTAPLVLVFTLQKKLFSTHCVQAGQVSFSVSLLNGKQQHSKYYGAEKTNKSHRVWPWLQPMQFMQCDLRHLNLFQIIRPLSSSLV